MVSIEKLVDGAFEFWRFGSKQQLYLKLRVCKLYEQLTKEEKAEWTKKVAKAHKVIVTTINNKLLLHIMKCKMSKEMYEKLCNCLNAAQ